MKKAPEVFECSVAAAVTGDLHSRRLPLVTVGYRWLPLVTVVTVGYRWLPLVTVGYRWLPLVTVNRYSSADWKVEALPFVDRLYRRRKKN